MLHRIVSILGILAALLAVAFPAASHAAGGSPRDTSDDVSELKRIVKEQAEAISKLADRVKELEGKKADPAENDIPSMEIPTGDTAAAKPKALALPDISVIGNHIGKFLVPPGEDGRNSFRLHEIELTLQQPVYSGTNFVAVFAGGDDSGFALSAEEAYITSSRPFGAPFDASAGKRRIAFGRTNQLHPHQRPYVDQPAAISAMLGPHGLVGNGASLNYTLPTRSMYANLEVGLWRTADAPNHSDEEGEEHQGEPGLGASGDLPVSRLWLSKSVGSCAEVGGGASYALGRSVHGNNVDLFALDATYRAYPSTFRGIRAQAEAYWHRTNDREEATGRHTRAGWFGLLAYAPTQYDEFGLRFDNTKYPWPIDGADRSLSLFWTNRLTEATALRLQLKHGTRSGDVLLPERRGYNEVFLQFLWGAGTHTHPLQ